MPAIIGALGYWLLRLKMGKDKVPGAFRALADVAHEFQTPLAILKANLEVVSGRRKGDATGALNIMGATLDRMSRLVQYSLASAREYSTWRLLNETVNIEDLIKEIYDDCAILAEDKEIALSCESDAGIVRGDRDRLKEVILNLIGNALKHTAVGGSITVTGKNMVRWVEIIVRDTGAGIPKEDLPYIFERFYRIRSDEVTGAGIGLDICRRVVEAHGGSMSVQSEFGSGSRFTVILPAK